jgi:hypothetical protein
MKWIFILVFVVSCSSQPTSSLQEPLPYQTGGIEQFFLPELPSWANGNLNANCVRGESVRFLNYEALERVYGLDPLKKLELQAQFHRKFKERYGKKIITPQEDSALFLQTLEQVQGGLRDYRFPKEGSIHIVWWDQLKMRANAIDWLKKLALTQDPIVLVSMCMDSIDLEAWIERTKLTQLGLMSFGHESMNIVRKDQLTMPGLVIPLDEFFPPERSNLWLMGQPPVEFPLGYNIRNFEE